MESKNFRTSAFALKDPNVMETPDFILGFIGFSIYRMLFAPDERLFANVRVGFLCLLVIKGKALAIMIISFNLRACFTRGKGS